MNNSKTILNRILLNENGVAFKCISTYTKINENAIPSENIILNNIMGTAINVSKNYN